ncbi:MAG: serine/threonine protein kinase [Myxococcaceae bacterium]|nr:serine/threonine protein kinase [Myxococcaceae bacterium]
MLSKLCEALDFVHGRGVLHRDLKPSNVFVGNEGQLWLLDLGLAHEAGTELTRTSTTDLLGAVAYLAPEVLLGRRDADRRADVFSLGCLAFEAFTGKTPFSSEPRERRDVLAHQLHSLPPDANALEPSLPAGVGAFLRTAMAKVPVDRPSTAGTFALELQRLCGVAADGTAAGAQAASALVVPVRPAPRPPEPVTDPREAVTAPSDPVVPLVAPEPTRIAAIPAPAPAPREGPTGPSRQQLAKGYRRAFIALSVVATVMLVLLALAFFSGTPEVPAPVPLPPSARPSPSVVMVKPDVPLSDEQRAPVGYLIAEGPKPPPLKTVDPGQETYKPLNYARFKGLRPKRVQVLGGASGVGPPVVEIRVFAADGPKKDLRADVVFDGVRKGMSPVKVRTTVGQHLVQVSREPYPETELELVVSAGSRQSFEIELQMPGAEEWSKEATAAPPVKGEKTPKP